MIGCTYSVIPLEEVCNNGIEPSVAISVSLRTFIELVEGTLPATPKLLGIYNDLQFYVDEAHMTEEERSMILIEQAFPCLCERCRYKVQVSVTH